MSVIQAQPNNNAASGTFTVAMDAGLISAATLYAVWLRSHKIAEPDFVWAEVAAGVALCLADAGIRGRFLGGDWQAQERRVWRSFVLAGIPIIVGELIQWSERRQTRRRLAERWGG